MTDGADAHKGHHADAKQGAVLAVNGTTGAVTSR